MRSISGYRGFLMLFVGIWQTTLSAQQADTVVNIPPMKVVAPSLIGDEADTVDISSTNALNTITSILSSQSSIYFRDFGPGSSSTVSIFGSKPNEVALIWNGIKVANPMLGVNDYSMISALNLTSLRIARVGSSTIFGAGSGAGAIMIDQNVAKSDLPVTVSAGWTSLNRFSGGGEYTNSRGKWKHRTSINGMGGKNNFRYTSLEGSDEQLAHAHSNYLSASHHTVYQRAPHRYWTLSLWSRKQNREIPPALTEPSSEATQSDAFIRSVIQYHNLMQRHHLNVKAYYGYQHQHYVNPPIKLDARHLFHNAQIRVDNQWQPRNNVYFKYGVLNNLFIARSDNYTDIHHQNRFTVYVQPRYEFDKVPLVLTGLIQPGWVNGHSPGWTNEIKVKYKNSSLGYWVLFANQNIIWPTLNDLYWSPGGNPDLLPEKNRMAGLSGEKKWSDNLLSSITFYYRRAENWIQWLPTKLGYWRPFNARKGKSYGIHMQSGYHIKENIRLKAGYQFVRTYVLDDSSNRNQAIYTPAHMWNLNGKINVRDRWLLHANGEYTSTRYVTRDHFDALDPYFLLHTGIRYNLKNNSLVIGLQIRNLLDAEYQGIKNRPMPGRQIEINTQIKF